MIKEQKDKLIKFFSEIYMLKRNKHEGFRLAGVQHPDSLSDHVAIAAQLAYIIGEMEGLDGKTCATMVLFHDNGEARITDQHKVAARYINNQKSEHQAFIEQMDLLPENIKNNIVSLYEQYETRSTPEGVVAKDADWLEAALQAKIYSEQGYQNLENWIDNVSKSVKTESARTLLAEIKTMKNFTTTWWEGIKLTREEIYDK